MPNLPTEDELRSSLDNIRGFDPDNPADGEVELFNIEKLVKLIHHYATKRELEAFQHGVKVGKYQAADKLYGDVCHIYMFGDNKDSAKARSISEWSAVGLLKDCEAFMNDNRKAYKEYLAELKAQKEQENK